MIKLLLPLLLLTLSPVQATPNKADVLCLELEFVLQEFVDQGSSSITQADVDRITANCYRSHSS